VLETIKGAVTSVKNNVAEMLSPTRNTRSRVKENKKNEVIIIDSSDEEELFASSGIKVNHCISY